MLGAIIGDIVGSRFEFDNHRDKAFELFGKGCFFTDDTVMTLAVAKAMMESSSDTARLGDAAVQFMHEIGRKYPHCGYGGRFMNWMFAPDPKPYDSFGNGAAMRVSACGFYARTEDEAKALSRAVTEVTHGHPEGIKGAEATSIAIFMAKNGATKSEIRARIEADYYPLDFTLDDIRETYQFNETCQETVPQAIEAFLEATSFEDTIRNAISVGGDSDTLAAIAGSIAEAYYGIEKKLERTALCYLDAELRSVYGEWKRFIKPFYRLKHFMMLTKYEGKLRESKNIRGFEGETYLFVLQHQEYGLGDYESILKANGLAWNETAMRNVDVSHLDAKAILALIVGLCRADHFSHGMLDEWCASGIVDPWLSRLAAIDSEAAPDDDSTNMTAFCISIENGEHKESLVLTTDELMINEHAGEVCEIAHHYKRGDKAIPYLFDPIFEDLEELLAADGWHNDDTLGMNPLRYALTATYLDGTQETRSGNYDRAHMPETAWANVVAMMRNFLGLFAFGDIVNMEGFMNAMRTGEVKYCGVEFSQGGKLYHYRTTNLLIHVGDDVIVPVGDANYEKEATVRTAEFCRWDDTPYPLEKTKEIIRKADEEPNGGYDIALLDEGANEDDESDE